jgi:hypothetical protein
MIGSDDKVLLTGCCSSEINQPATVIHAECNPAGHQAGGDLA